MNKVIVGGIGIVLLAFAYLALAPESKSEISTADLQCNGCNVLVIGFDALQGNHVHHLGYPRETTPTLDMLAEKGVSFSRNFAVASWTVPSFMSYFTSLYPSQHKVVNKFVTFTKDEKVISNLGKLSPEVETLADAFKAAGYRTGGFTGDAGVHSMFGYGQGFDTYYDATAFGSVGRAGDLALEWLEEDRDKPFFLWLHGYDAHGQFSELPEGYVSQFGKTSDEAIDPQHQRDLREEGLEKGQLFMEPDEIADWNSWYDSKIKDADLRIGHFLDELHARGLDENLVIIVIADHGTEIYDHRRFDHGYSLYNELIRVPMIITVPGKTIGKIIDTQVRSIDLAPTLFSMVGLEVSDVWKSQMEGESLIPVITGENTENRPVFSATDYRNYTHKRSYIAPDGWKLIYTLESGETELYNINTDYAEKKNVAQEEPEKTTELFSVLEDFLSNHLGEDVYGEWEIGCLPVYNDQCVAEAE